MTARLVAHREDCPALCRCNWQGRKHNSHVCTCDGADRLREYEELLAAARKVLGGFDAEVFVRNINEDHKPGWAVRALPYIAALGKLSKISTDVHIRSDAPFEEK